MQHEVCAAEKRLFHEGGYSPAYLVFGEGPGRLCERLSDEARDSVGWDDDRRHPADADEPSVEFAPGQR
eukprot:2559222-Lingulodinium_polyedra.AAC.1